MVHRISLFAAIRAMGWSPVQHSAPGRHPDGLGSTHWRATARVLSGGRIAVKSDSWEHAYSASHEIAESIHGFRHSAQMFCDQANILAAWHCLRSRLPSQAIRAYIPSLAKY